MEKSIEQAVRNRARGLCEYCHAAQQLYPERFQIDHIIARQHRGGDELENLALSCLECNRRKGPNIAGIDPDTGLITHIYSPRKQNWADHFEWNGAVLIGKTQQGRATIVLLDINHGPRVAVRQSLIEEGIFPPPQDRI